MKQPEKKSKIGPREQQLREMREKNFLRQPKRNKLAVVRSKKSGRGQ